MEKEKTYLLSEIILEIFTEEGNTDSHYNDFKLYYKEQKKRLIQIITSLGIEPSTLKEIDGVRFCISEKGKGIIKDLLSKYKTKTMKEIRKSNFKNISLEELTPILKQAEQLVGTKLDGERLKREIGEMYVITRFEMKKTLEEMHKTVLKQITDNIDRQFPIVTMKNLNDSDKIHLLQLYKQMLTETSKKWSSILDIVSELRAKEIEEISWGMAESEEPLTEEKLDKLMPLMFDEIGSVIWDAVSIYNQDIKEEAMSPVPKPSLDEIERVMKIIEEMELERKPNK